MSGLTQQELSYLQSVLNSMGGYSSNYGDVGPSLAQSIVGKAATGQLANATVVNVVERPLIFNQQFLGPLNDISNINTLSQSTIIDAGSF